MKLIRGGHEGGGGSGGLELSFITIALCPF
jgi:hypothetical protein